MIARPQILRWPSNSQLLVLAAAVQLILTISVYTIGRLGVLQAIDRNGCVTALTPDSATHLSEANSLSATLTQKGPREWLDSSANFHVRLYSLSLAILGSLFGANILSVEPVNLLSYISVLWLTFKLGEDLFDRRVSRLATVAIALWPSWLLHTTQPLKDQVFIVGLLTLVLVMTYWLTRTFSWHTGLTMAIAGAAALYVINLTRSGFWGFIMLAIVLIGVGLLLVRQIRERRILVWNMISASLIVLATSGTFLSDPDIAAESIVFEPPGIGSQNHPPVRSLSSGGDHAAQRLSQMRKAFLDLNKGSGADIDTNVKFKSTLDVVRYLPRATEIAFLAPFPNQWFKTGKRVGIAGRVLSGLEMSAFYVVEILALIGLWRSRSNLGVWLLFLVSSTGVVTLALAVINLGALYRLRYGFFILVLILGAHGLMTLLAQRQQRKTQVGRKA